MTTIDDHRPAPLRRGRARTLRGVRRPPGADARVWEGIQRDLPDESVVVVPSISLERTTAGSGTVMQAMEERALFLLLLLRQPRLEMIYVTSSPISEAIVEYYLGLLPGIIPSHARKRLRLVSVGRRIARLPQLEAPASTPPAPQHP